MISATWRIIALTLFTLPAVVFMVLGIVFLMLAYGTDTAKEILTSFRWTK